MIPPLGNFVRCDDTFNSTKFMGIHLTFSVDYKVISNHPSPKQSNLKVIHLVRVLFMEKIYREECAKENKEQKVKISKYQ